MGKNDDILKEFKNNYGAHIPSVDLPSYDPYFTSNKQIINHLMSEEKDSYSHPSYVVNVSRFDCICMRRELFDWLREVVTFRSADIEVLSQAGQLVDRFLSLHPTKVPEYQLVAITCLLISSKIKEPIPLQVSEAVDMTAKSVTCQQVIDQEIVISILLKWNFSTISPLEFIKPVIDFLPFNKSVKEIIKNSSTKIYTITFHLEDLSMYPPRYIAACYILYALQLTIPASSSEYITSSMNIMKQLLDLDSKQLREIFETLTSCFQPGTLKLSPDYSATKFPNRNSDGNGRGGGGGGNNKSNFQSNQSSNCVYEEDLRGGVPCGS